MRENVILKLRRPTKNKLEWLDQMAITFSKASQIGLDFAMENKTCGRSRIHNAAYYPARALGLPSDYARMAINNAVRHSRSYFGLRKAKRRVGKTKTIRPTTVGLGVNAYVLKETVLRVSTGRRGVYKWFPLSVPKKWLERLMFVKGDAKLFRREKNWFVSLPLRTPDTPASRAGEQTVIGVDLGIVRLATAKTPDRTIIWNGKPIRHRRERFATVRKRLQRHNRMDKVRKSKGKERRWQQDINHKISKQLVELAGKYTSPVLAFENLSGIRDRTKGSKRFRRMISSWAFRDLINKVEYKAQKAGVKVVFVDPRGTSRTCPKCSHSTRSNRPKQSLFKCVSCGYQGNADVIAAINITASAVNLLKQGPSDTACSVSTERPVCSGHGLMEPRER